MLRFPSLSVGCMKSIFPIPDFFIAYPHALDTPAIPANARTESISHAHNFPSVDLGRIPIACENVVLLYIISMV